MNRVMNTRALMRMSSAPSSVARGCTAVISPVRYGSSTASSSPAIGTSPSLSRAEIDVMVEGVLKRQRRHIAKAVTLAESTRADHAAAISEVLRLLRERRSAQGEKSFAERQRRIAISGSPGAGKSCFIDALGYYLADKLGLTVGVLAVDPSSAITGGSILGDKTRMEQLSYHPNAFVRPSPSRGHLGGVTARCWETLELFEAAQFDVTLIETVGVGQSETEAAHLSDLFVLLVPPASGDELQGVKKGIVEVADAVIVTKRDGPRVDLAETTRGHYKRAVMLTSRMAPPAPLPQGQEAPQQMSEADCLRELEQLAKRKPVIAVSSETGYQIAEAWQAIDERWLAARSSGVLDGKRRTQRLEHYTAYLESELVARAHRRLREWSADGVAALAAGNDGGREVTTMSLDDALRVAVESGDLTPRAAGDAAIERLLL